MIQYLFAKNFGTKQGLDISCVDGQNSPGSGRTHGPGSICCGPQTPASVLLGCWLQSCRRRSSRFRSLVAPPPSSPAPPLHPRANAYPTRDRPIGDRGLPSATAHAVERPEIWYPHPHSLSASRRTAADPVKPIRFVFGGSRGGRRGPINRSGEMRQQRGGVGVGAGRRGDDPGLLTRAVDRVFRFVRLAEFEIFFVLFFLIAFFLFKNLVSTHTNLAFLCPERFGFAGIGIGSSTHGSFVQFCNMWP